jgi:hypothetical protein
MSAKSRTSPILTNIQNLLGTSASAHVPCAAGDKPPETHLFDDAKEKAATEQVRERAEGEGERREPRRPRLRVHEDRQRRQWKFGAVARALIDGSWSGGRQADLAG